jgi:hypothetical protein
MQQLEIALKKVFDRIGNDYVLPQGEFITDDFGNGNQIRNPFYGQTPSKLKFMFGTQKELNIWLATTTDKYPLVWLVYPFFESYNNNSQSFYTYKKVRLVFAINNDADKLVQTRLQTTRFILDQLTARFTELMRNSKFKKFILIDKQVDIKEKFWPNYSEKDQKESGTVDVWDAISFDCDLHLIPNCIK